MTSFKRKSVQIWIAGASLGLALGLAGCGDAPAPDAGWPGGALLVAERDALLALADRAESLSGTPLANVANAFREGVPDCPRIQAHAPDGDFAALAASLRCYEAGSRLAVVEAARGPSQLLFALPTPGAGRAIGRATFSGADLALDLEWMPSSDRSALDLVLPGETPAGPSRLGDASALVHLRVRPERGIDLENLIPAESQAHQLFQLRANLFTEAVLDGAWEVAVYLPPAGSEMPRLALALDVRSRSTALRAARAFVAELGKTWSVEPQAFALGEQATGACLAELRVLPELAPCYVATEQSLIIGWNAASLSHALGTPPAAATEHPGHVELDLALFAEADALLSRHLASDEPRPSLRWPWQRAMASARRGSDGLVRVRALLEGAVDT